MSEYNLQQAISMEDCEKIEQSIQELGYPLCSTFYNIGNDAGRMGKHKFAVLCYLKTIMLISNEPGYAGHLPSALHNLGTSFRKLGMYDEALDAYENCLQIDSKRSKTYFQIALVQAGLGEDQLAEEALDKFNYWGGTFEDISRWIEEEKFSGRTFGLDQLLDLIPEVESEYCEDAAEILKEYCSHVGDEFNLPYVLNQIVSAKIVAHPFSYECDIESESEDCRTVYRVILWQNRENGGDLSCLPSIFHNFEEETISRSNSRKKLVTKVFLFYNDFYYWAVYRTSDDKVGMFFTNFEKAISWST